MNSIYKLRHLQLVCMGYKDKSNTEKSKLGPREQFQQKSFFLDLKRSRLVGFRKKRAL